MAVVVVLTNLPDSQSAFNVASTLLQERLAACVNVLAPATALYRWEGKEERATEVPLVAKTTTEQYAALEEAIRRLHPYEVPEIVALPVVAGLPAYLDWVASECGEAGRTAARQA